MATIFLSVGHSGGEVGAVAHGTTEFAECERIGRTVASTINNASTNTPVVFVPTTLKLASRLNWIKHNISAHDLLLELHMDSASPSANGATAFYRDGNMEAKSYAQKVIDAYTASSEIRSRGVKPDTNTRHGSLGICRVHPTACLLELGFLSNKEDLEKMRERSAEALLKTLAALGVWEYQDDQPSVWAIPAFEDAARFGFSKVRPKAPMDGVRLRQAMIKLPKAVNVKEMSLCLTQSDAPITYEEWITALWKAGFFKPKK